jgi:plasmid stabilization system protein ParE
MILPVSISGRAEADLSHQYRWYLENANLDVAERFLKAFDVSLGMLARQPGLGQARKFRVPELAGIRFLPVGGRFGVHLISGLSLDGK